MLDRPSSLPLTPRELDVMVLIAQGLSNKQIGTKLGISAITAKNHVATIINKLQCINRTATIIRAQQLGILDSSGKVVTTVSRDEVVSLQSEPSVRTWLKWNSLELCEEMYAIRIKVLKSRSRVYLSSYSCSF